MPAIYWDSPFILQIFYSRPWAGQLSKEVRGSVHIRLQDKNYVQYVQYKTPNLKGVHTFTSEGNLALNFMLKVSASNFIVVFFAQWLCNFSRGNSHNLFYWLFLKFHCQFNWLFPGEKCHSHRLFSSVKWLFFFNPFLSVWSGFLPLTDSNFIANCSMYSTDAKWNSSPSPINSFLLQIWNGAKCSLNK